MLKSGISINQKFSMHAILVNKSLWVNVNLKVNAFNIFVT